MPSSISPKIEMTPPPAFQKTDTFSEPYFSFLLYAMTLEQEHKVCILSAMNNMHQLYNSDLYKKHDKLNNFGLLLWLLILLYCKLS